MGYCDEWCGLYAFIDEAQSRFGGIEVGSLLRDAINLKYSLDDMLRIIYLYLKNTSDALIDENAFLADGHCLGLGNILNILRSIWADVEWHGEKK